MLAKRHYVWHDYPILQSSLCENRQMCIFYVLYLQCKENQNLSIQSISVSNSQDNSISNSQCASVSIIWYHYLLLYLFTLLGIRPQSLSTISYEMMQIFYSSCLQATWSLVFQSQQLNPKLWPYIIAWDFLLILHWAAWYSWALPFIAFYSIFLNSSNLEFDFYRSFGVLLPLVNQPFCLHIFLCVYYICSL